MQRLLLMALVTACFAAVAFGEEWPQFLGPNRNGVSPEKGLLRTWPASGPKVLWTIDVGPGYGGAAIRDGKVYILDRIGDEQDVLRVLDFATGKEEWRYAYDAPGRASHHGSRSTPAVDDKYVFTVGLFGHFHCIDKATKKPVWKKHLLEDYGGKKPQWAVTQSPFLYKDVVIAAPQSGSVGVVAYEKATGKERWRSEGIGSMYYHSPFATTVGGAEQIIMQSTKNVVGLDPANGKILWTYGFRVSTAGIPAPTPLGQDRFFLTGGYEAGSEIIQVAKQGDGFEAKRLHRFDDVGSHIQQPILVGDYIYAVCNTNSKANGMVCFGLDGQIKWKTQRDPYLCKGNTLMTGDGVFYQLDGREGELHIVDPSPEAFKSVGKVKLLGGKEIWGPMSLSDGKLVIRDQSQMKCLDVRAQ
ncbi:MAG TPA: PQQ-binding-like beta-propeller repeat protein [Phycisphaerae bacterium]|nr:PQQ-binding-like beta-propeller repeat protein [Phycisphaerae bacterium]